ncbi:YegP family protein [Pseudomonas helmanticensis]
MQDALQHPRYRHEYRIRRNETWQWRCRLRAGNHETIASGESYVNKADCLHVIGLIKAVQGETPVKEI